MWLMIHPELFHLAKMLHPDSELQTDAGLFQRAEVSTTVRLLNIKMAIHVERVERTVIRLKVAVSVSSLMWSLVAGHDDCSLWEAEEKQMRGFKVFVWKCGGL